MVELGKKRINFWRPFAVGPLWDGGCIAAGRFGSGNGVSGPAIVLGLRVLGKRLWVMQREVWFFGRVFRRRAGHKPHQEVARKGNALIILKVNKGREERGIFFPCVLREEEN